MKLDLRKRGHVSPGSPRQVTAHENEQDPMQPISTRSIVKKLEIMSAPTAIRKPNSIAEVALFLTGSSSTSPLYQS